MSRDDVNVRVEKYLFLGKCFCGIDSDFFFYFFDYWYYYYMEFVLFVFYGVDFFVFWV